MSMRVAILATVLCTILTTVASAGQPRFLAPSDGEMYFYRDDIASKGLVTEYTGDPESDYKGETDIPRLVEFYSPFCGACRTFQAKFLALALELQSTNVKFYAVSCSAHPEECMPWNLTGFPALLAFPAGVDATDRKSRIDLLPSMVESAAAIRDLLDAIEIGDAKSEGTNLIDFSSATTPRDKVDIENKNSLVNEQKEKVLTDTNPVQNREDSTTEKSRDAKDVTDDVAIGADVVDVARKKLTMQKKEPKSTLLAEKQNLRNTADGTLLIPFQGNGEVNKGLKGKENEREDSLPVIDSTLKAVADNRIASSVGLENDLEKRVTSKLSKPTKNTAENVNDISTSYSILKTDDAAKFTPKAKLVLSSGLTDGSVANAKLPKNPATTLNITNSFDTLQGAFTNYDKNPGNGNLGLFDTAYEDISSAHEYHKNSKVPKEYDRDNFHHVKQDDLVDQRLTYGEETTNLVGTSGLPKFSNRSRDDDYGNTDHHNSYPKNSQLIASEEPAYVANFKNANRDMDKWKDKYAKKRQEMDQKGTQKVRKRVGEENKAYVVAPEKKKLKQRIEVGKDFKIGLQDQALKFREKFWKRFPIVKRRFQKTVEEELLSDVALSFVAGLKYDVFTSNLPLDARRKKALQSWLELLSVSLPPESGIHIIVSDLTANIDFVSKKRANLIHILDMHPLAITRWSLSCSRGKASVGFTCGFWKLLHLVSVGLAEMRGGLELPSTIRSFSPMDAASVLREYMALFFSCIPCRSHFLAQYDECRFRRCDRLALQSENTSQELWMQFPLWLWEVHNDVNIRVFNERKETASKKLKKQLDNTDDIKVIFPSMEQCFECFEPDGTWGEENVYNYLVRLYWNHADKSLAEGAFLAKYDALVSANANMNRVVTSIMYVFGIIVMVWLIWAKRNYNHVVRPYLARRLIPYRTIGRRKTRSQ